MKRRVSVWLRKTADWITHLPQELSGGGWWPLLREAFSGAWQRGVQVGQADVITHSTVWACVTLIAFDIGKMCVKLLQEDKNGISSQVDSAAFSPVLRKPNHYQNRIQFYIAWILSKLLWGNTYVLKERDGRTAVVGLYILDPKLVTVLVAPDGEVFYQLGRDTLSGVLEGGVTVPASEIIHDIYFAPYHPLCGVGPIMAAWLAATHSLKIQHGALKLFANGSRISGVLTAPGQISAETAKRLEEHWEANYAGEQNAGKVVALGDGLKFEPMVQTAVESQLIEQLKWGDEKICSTFHVPAYMVGVGAPPNYNNIEALNQQYYSQCLQVLIESLELCLEEGLGAAPKYAIEFDLDGLLRMDSATKMKTATDGVKGGIYTPNEGRAIFNKKPLTGGDTVYLQQQDFSIEALAKRDAQGPPPPTVTPPLPPSQRSVDMGEVLTLVTRSLEEMNWAA